MPGATGTNQLTLEVSDIAPVNLSSRLSYLLGYPHGCLEQITSKGFPQLYISSFTDLTPQQAKSTEEAVKEVIRRLRSYQTVDGLSPIGGWNEQQWLGYGLRYSFLAGSLEERLLGSRGHETKRIE